MGCAVRYFDIHEMVRVGRNDGGGTSQNFVPE